MIVENQQTTQNQFNGLANRDYLSSGDKHNLFPKTLLLTHQIYMAVSIVTDSPAAANICFKKLGLSHFARGELQIESWPQLDITTTLRIKLHKDWRQLNSF
jgi:hypothetical protein